MNTKLLRNRIRTAYIWITHFFSLSIEDSIHRMTDMSSWELFPPSFYRTHTEEEIEEATERTVQRIRVLLKEMEEYEKKEKEEDGI